MNNNPHNSFPYESLILRNAILPDILGNDIDAILYWAGRNLANNFSISTIDDTKAFYKKMHWGQLNIIKQKKNTEIYKLNGNDVNTRLKLDSQNNFQIETGFLAQIRQTQLNCSCEATYELKNQDIIITCLIDHNFNN